MYLITAVTSDENSKEVYVVCADEGYRITVHDAETIGICEGAELDGDSFAALCEAGERLACIKKAFDFLSYGDLSRRQLCERLCRKFSKEMSADVASLMEERGYIDDRRLAEKYAETFYVFKNMGLSRIKNELYRRGIGREDIESALARYENEPQAERALEYAKKKFDLTLVSDRKYRAKVYSALMRAGFSGGDISDALRDFESEQTWQ